eukprot:5996758-Ditylum_brightwellii.AAC.1
MRKLVKALAEREKKAAATVEKKRKEELKKKTREAKLGSRTTILGNSFSSGSSTVGSKKAIGANVRGKTVK